MLQSILCFGVTENHSSAGKGNDTSFMPPKLHMDLLQLRTWPQIQGGCFVLFSFFLIFLNAFSNGKYALSTNYWFLRAMAACNANLGLCLCKLTWRDTIQSQAEAAERLKLQSAVLGTSNPFKARVCGCRAGCLLILKRFRKCRSIC